MTLSLHFENRRRRASEAGRDMQRIFQIALLTLLICLCVAVTATLGVFLYVRYGDAPSRISGLEKRIEDLESALRARKQWRVNFYTNWIFTASGAPEDLRHIRVRNDLPGVQTFPMDLGKVLGRTVAAWLTDLDPPSEILKFQHLRIAFRDGRVVLDAIPRPNESISVRYVFTVIREDD